MPGLCAFHPELPANNTCTGCTKLICEACSTYGYDDAINCPICVGRRGERKVRNRLVLFAIGVFALAGIAAVLLVFDGKDKDEPPTSPTLTQEFPYGRWKAEINDLALAFDNSPCNKTIAFELANAMNQVADLTGAIRVVDAYDAAGCDEYRKLWWRKMHAHEQLGQWEESLAVGDKLVTARPLDNDYWGWRGRANAKLERTAAAVVDLRQSMALRSTRAVAEMLHELDPCEGAFALLRYVNRKPDAEDAEMQARQTLARPECTTLPGAGSFEAEWAEGTERPTVEVTIAGKTLQASLAPHQGMTAISQATADELGIAPTGEAVKAVVDRKLIEARTAVVDELAIGEAKVLKVPVVIVPALAGKVPLALGQSTVWRFEVSSSPISLKLYELPRE